MMLWISKLSIYNSMQGCGAQLICALRSLCAAPGRKYEKQCALRSGILCAPACALRFFCALRLRLTLFCHVRFYTQLIYISYKGKFTTSSGAPFHNPVD